MRKFCFGFMFCMLISTTSLASEVQDGGRLGRVVYDFNRDGHMDKAELIQNEDVADLYIFLGRGHGQYRAAVVGHNIVGSTPMIGDPAHLSINRDGVMTINSSHIGIGRDKYEAQTKLRMHGAYMNVIGYTIAHWDSLDPDAATRCDVNFLNKWADVMKNGRTHKIRHHLYPVNFLEWHTMQELKGVCP